MSKDIIYREDAIKAIEELPNAYNGWSDAYDKAYIIGTLEEVPKTDRRQGEWIPCSERLPKDLEVVNITWINHRPMTYYADIKDEPFTATAIHYRDKWWWYSPICEDLLAEYGKSECDKMDADIEVTAWMPLPKPSAERKGEWIDTHKVYCGSTVFACSECKSEIEEIPTYYNEPMYKWCPYCGARMKGAGDGSC